MNFKFYNSGICFSEIIFDNNNVNHNILNIFTGKWVRKEIGEDVRENYPLDINRLIDRVKKTLKFNFKTENESFELDGDRYVFYKAIGDAKIYAHRGVQNPMDIVLSGDEFVGIIHTDRTGCSVLIKPGYENITPIKLWKEINNSRKIYTVKNMQNFKIAMEDGIKLNTFLWLPNSSDEKYSTILLRTPYGSMSYWLWLRKYVLRGYAVIIQDVRGREESEGEWIPFYYEKQDGNDTLNYIANQSWSNGKIGMIGGSYSGGVQWAADVTGNPHLKAIVSLVTSGSPFGDIPRRGGAILSGTMAWSFAMAENKVNSQNMIRNDWDQLLNTIPIKDIPKKGLGKDVPFITQWMNHEDYDEFWESADWTKNPVINSTPALIVSGWYDDDGMGSKEAWKLCSDQKRSNVKMIIGPWLHNANTTRDINGIDFGNESIRYDMDKIYLNWFDHYLNELENDIENLDPVQYYVCGLNKWKVSNAWPIDSTKYSSLYLGRNKKCNFAMDKKEGFEEYYYNPSDPTPFLIDVSTNECNVPANYSKIENRGDVVTFTSDILKYNITISGEVKAILYASSSCKDTDWIVRITEVIDENISIRISDGILRARYHNGFNCKNLLEPYKVYEFNIEMFQASHLFRKGSCIRISIMSGAKNLVFPNFNTGDNPANDMDMIVACQKIYFGNKYPSAVILPIVN